MLYGVASRLARGPLSNASALKGPYDSLLKLKEFLDAVTKATADVESVNARLTAAKRTFAAVQ